MGWPLANLTYELWPKNELPDFSSPIGKMFIFLWIMKQEREFLAHRAQIQAIIAGEGNSKAVKSSFEDLANAFNPYLEGHKKDEEKKAKERMLKEINKGALSIVTNGPWIGGKSKGQLKKSLTEQFGKNQEQKTPMENQFMRRRVR